MYSLDNAFNELLDKIRDPDALNPAKSAPVFYFRYSPELMLIVKKHLPRLISRVKKETGFEDRKGQKLKPLILRLISQKSLISW